MGRLRQAGVTLVELIIAVVIISVAVTGILMAYVQMVGRSADPMIEAQALAIAEAYMDEILAKPVTGSSTVTCTAGIPRANCALVGHYDGLTGAPSDQFGNPIAGLGDYQITVQVGSGADAVGANALGVGEEASVTVTVVRGTTTIQLRGYKVDY